MWPIKKSRRVLRIESHIFIAKVTSPERAMARSERKAETQTDFPVVLQIRGGRGGVKGLRRAGMIEEHVAQPQRQLLFLEHHPRVTRRGYDAAPVGVSAKDRRLDQGAVRDRLGHAPGLRIVPQPFHR